jgi:hypothetical protein
MPVLAEHDLKSHLKNKVNFVCKNCGQALTAFLRDMAEHNTKVVCSGRTCAAPHAEAERHDRLLCQISGNIG